MGLEDWEGLLRRFCKGIKPFEFYHSSANGDLAQVATLMADEFHSYWWTSEEYKESREINKSRVRQRASPLRIEICNYLKSLSIESSANPDYREEISLFSELSVDGIITTNWDDMLETVFSEYKLFIGQSELLFSNPQSIAEIYKIHGSIGDPSSLVLTKEDYDNFENKNAYLAAKLVTLFVEHPIIFLGYSLNDPHICSLLRNILHAIGPDKIHQLQNNLIFVQRAHGKGDAAIPSLMAIEQSQLPITIIKTDNFSPIFQALNEVKRKIPTRILRYFKEQLYELVRSTEPTSKLYVKHIDEIQSKDDVEFVAGVGVAAEERASIKGYEGMSALDLFSDLIVEDRNLRPKPVLQNTVPNLGRWSAYLPIFKHLKAAGIASHDHYLKSGLSLEKHIPKTLDHYRISGYEKPFLRDAKHMSAQDIVANFPPEKAVIYLGFLERDKFDLEVVRAFLKNIFSKLTDKIPTSARKLACLYDYMANGWGIEIEVAAAK